jgi:hypothetical protein
MFHITKKIWVGEVVAEVFFFYFISVLLLSKCINAPLHKMPQCILKTKMHCAHPYIKCLGTYIKLKGTGAPLHKMPNAYIK